MDLNKPVNGKTSWSAPVVPEAPERHAAALDAHFGTEPEVHHLRMAARGLDGRLASLFMPLDAGRLDPDDDARQIVFTTRANAAHLKAFYERNKAGRLGRRSVVMVVEDSAFLGELPADLGLWSGLPVSLEVFTPGLGGSKS